LAVSGLIHCFVTAVSLALQYGVSLNGELPIGEKTVGVSMKMAMLEGAGAGLGGSPTLSLINGS
jgi:hypothetical protein